MRLWLAWNCLVDGFGRDPLLALRLLLRLKFWDRKAWRQFSLAVHGKDMVADFYAASREVGIRPFLMWGTLLGFVREGALLEHDTDIDAGLLSGDYPKKDELSAAMQRRGYRLTRDVPYKLRFSRPNEVLHLDIDVFYPWQGKLLSSSVSESGDFHGLWFERDLLERLREADFLGLRVLVPVSAEALLKAIYGSWQTPDPTYDSRADRSYRVAIAAERPRPEFTLTAPPN